MTCQALIDMRTGRLAEMNRRLLAPYSSGELVNHFIILRKYLVTYMGIKTMTGSAYTEFWNIIKSAMNENNAFKRIRSNE